MGNKQVLRLRPGASGFRARLNAERQDREQERDTIHGGMRQLQPALWQSEVAQAGTSINEPLLDSALGYMRGEDDRFWLGLNETVRHHNRTHAVRLLVWVHEALRIPGYFDQRLALKGIPLAPNARSVERAQYAAAARLASYDGELDEG